MKLNSGINVLSNNKTEREIIKALLQLPSPTNNDVQQIKKKAASKYKLGCLPSNAKIIAAMNPEERNRLLSVLRRKGMRTISGVAIVAVMTRPHRCPQPEPCHYCPGGPSIGAPQSYTGFEPAAMRGRQNCFDPFLQVNSRIEQLKAIGHRVDKVELIIMGGTFPATPIEYQRWFVQRCLDAMTNTESANLEEAKANAERSEIRNVGITVETRPDWAKEPHVDLMLDMGVTRVELGVQNPSDKIYRLVGRTHSVSDVVQATQIAKDAGLKVVYHLMPGLPGSNPKKDLKMFQRVFEDPEFKPDMLKIYPCLVIKGTKIYDLYRQGVYQPYTTNEAAKLIGKIKKIIPPWIRIMRVQRDIPAQLIVAGVKKSNLRQLAQQKLLEESARCGCIRCREVGQRLIVDQVIPDQKKIEILSHRYEASEGTEIFISAEDQENKVLIGYLRLRLPSTKAHRPEIQTPHSAIVRELHVYGPLVPLGQHSAEAWQHKGYGALLLKRAEQTSQVDYDLKKILVISALGTKQYYKRFGYKPDGVYVSKSLVK